MSHPKPTVIGITGASGSILGFRLIAELLQLDQPVELVMTEKSAMVVQEEIALKVSGSDSAAKSRSIVAHLGLPAEKSELLQIFGNQRLDAPPSSGTHLTRGMVVVPCSMGTLGRIANGISDNLVSRAADVTLKEGRKLILVPRESPMNAIHLKNQLTLAQLGVVILPPVLTFYLPVFAQSVEGQIDYTLGKILDQLGLEHTLHERWGKSYRG